jgi:membrane-bound lytic murein transglycosylase D
MRPFNLTSAVLCLLLLNGCSTLTPPASSTATEPDSKAKAPAVETRQVPAAADAQPAPEADLWSALRTDFSLPDKQHARVKKQARVYKKNPHHVERVFDTGSPYIAYIHAEIRKRDLPGEIALLPFIESGYNPFAYSSGHAAGLWQFIPSTGKHFGLKQDQWYDGRRDVIASTEAALDYLEQLNGEFRGDWLLTFAAYNAGGGTVRKAIRKNRENGKPADYWHLDLPTETEKYIPKLLAISTVVEFPDHYNVSLPDIGTEPVFVAIDAGRQLDISMAAELAGMDADRLYAINPGLSHRVMPPEGPYTLAVPAAKSGRFETRLAQLPDDQGIRQLTHVVQPGETLSGIAQRYQTSVAALGRINGIEPDRIRSGQTLAIIGPPKSTQTTLVAKRQRNINETSRRLTYRVKPGDNLWNIARRHRVSVGQVANWNRIDNDALLRPGQKLVIWKGGKAPASAQKPVIHTVRRGDSLYRISREYNVSVAQLRKWNNLPEGRYLQPGQDLKLFVDATQATRRGKG